MILTPSILKQVPPVKTECDFLPCADEKCQLIKSAASADNAQSTIAKDLRREVIHQTAKCQQLQQCYDRHEIDILVIEYKFPLKLHFLKFILQKLK